MARWDSSRSSSPSWTWDNAGWSWRSRPSSPHERPLPLNLHVHQIPSATTREKANCPTALEAGRPTEGGLCCREPRCIISWESNFLCHFWKHWSLCEPTEWAAWEPSEPCLPPMHMAGRWRRVTAQKDTHFVTAGADDRAGTGAQKEDV